MILISIKFYFYSHFLFNVIIPPQKKNLGIAGAVAILYNLMLFMAGRPTRWVSSPSNECLLIFALKKGTVFSPGDTLSLLLITFNFSGELLSISCRSTTSKLKITEGSHLRKQKSLREFKIKSLKSHCGWLNACEILHQWGMVETCWNMLKPYK